MSVVVCPQEGGEDLKKIAGYYSKLRNEVQTDKPLVPLTDNGDDVGDWNRYLDMDSKQQEPNSPSWFTSAWLYIECYFYRRIQEGINLRY